MNEWVAEEFADAAAKRQETKPNSLPSLVASRECE